MQLTRGPILGETAVVLLWNTYFLVWIETDLEICRKDGSERCGEDVRQGRKQSAYGLRRVLHQLDENGYADGRGVGSEPGGDEYETVSVRHSSILPSYAVLTMRTETVLRKVPARILRDGEGSQRTLWTTCQTRCP